ncbi:copper oxidase, partial [Streptomyces sp. NPDC058255]
MDRRGFNRRMLLGGAAVATGATSLSAASRAVSADGPARTAPA